VDLFKDAPTYVIDTCSIIDLRVWYPPEMAGDVWEVLGRLLDNGVVASVEEVLEELKVQEDRVLEWAMRHRGAFLPIDVDLQRETKRILEAYPQLIDPKRRKSSADPFVIAAAQLYGATVVTEEKPSRPPARPKIPNVCQGLELECIRIVELFRREGYRFVLASETVDSDGRDDIG